MRGGWIKLHRDMMRWQGYEDALMVHLYIHLLLSANYEERQWRGITVGRGQLVTSIQRLADAIHTTPKIVHNRLCRLEQEGLIGKRTGNQYTLITINKYDDYLLGETTEGKAREKQRENEGKQLKNIIRNNKELIKKNSPLTPQGGKDCSLDKNEIEPPDSIHEVSQAPFPPVAHSPLSPAFEKWLAYKKAKRQSYRSESALKACYKRLERYSGGDPKVAMEIIEQSIAMNYSGFFEPKQHKTKHENRPESITNAAESEKGTRYSTI
ncbi:MAG: hypothetical protein PUK66_07910 [Bacteroidales bacterium]|uniref:hypothetical protein n=1 Tax=Porphyromonas sp. TaxID=1924944 RepID=UPI002972026E|nr:hypothetical protein [Porphyromonas sp.]MDD7438740.1 hypothetical protein [Bacteroidales bacterium]MDY3066998.1 hypothetical protein [Porphyromonas sp.]